MDDWKFGEPPKTSGKPPKMISSDEMSRRELRVLWAIAWAVSFMVAGIVLALAGYWS